MQVWESCNFAHMEASDQLTAVCAALDALASRLCKATQTLLASRSCALKACRLLLDEMSVVAGVAGGAGEVDKEAPAPAAREASAQLTLLSRHLAAVVAAKKKLDKIAGEDTTAVATMIADAERAAGKLANSAIDDLMVSGGPVLDEVVSFSRGTSIDDDAVTWRSLMSDDKSWSEVLELAKSHLLPIARDALQKKLKELDDVKEKFMALLGAHKIDKPWAGLDAALQQGKVTVICHMLIEQFSGSAEPGVMRKAVRDETMKLKKLGVAVSTLPVGLQQRMTAALRGRNM